MFDFLKPDVSGLKNVINGFERYYREKGGYSLTEAGMLGFAMDYYGLRLGTLIGLSESRAREMQLKAHAVNLIAANLLAYRTPQDSLLLTAELIEQGVADGPLPADMARAVRVSLLSVLCGLLAAEGHSLRDINLPRLIRKRDGLRNGLPDTLYGF